MDREQLRQLATDPAAFQAELVIPSAYGSRRFADVMAPFQQRDFAELNPSLVALAAGQKPPIGRFWFERTKGGSKDTDIAVCLLWLLAFARKPLAIQVGAYDQAQASETRKIIRQVLQLDAPLNRLLAGTITVQAGAILNHRTGSECSVLTTDSQGKHGSRPDVVLVNELSHIGNQEFAETLMDNADKVPLGVVIIATNAGFKPSWQFNWRLVARDSSRWYFSVFNDPSPWVSAEDLEESRLRNSAKRFARLWLGRWVSGGGDALDPELIEAAVVQTAPMQGDETGYTFVAGLDLATKRDRAALVVLGCRGVQAKVRLVWCKSWAPSADGRIDLMAIERAVLDARQRFGLSGVYYDPTQAALMAQRLSRMGVPMHEVPFVGKNLGEMAWTLLQLFASCEIELYRSHLDSSRDLVRDLGRLTIVERPFGYKLESARDETGHADLAIALAIALPRARRQAGTALIAQCCPTSMAMPRKQPAECGIQLDRSGGRIHRQPGRLGRGHSYPQWQPTESSS